MLSSDNKVVLNVEKISKSFFLKNGIEKKALENISFELLKGDSLGIIGQNGSGKSTLLKVLSSIIKPSKGTFSHYGKVRSILDLGHGVLPELTGLENITLSANIEGLNKELSNNYIQQVVHFADIGEYIHEPVKNYSSGMFLRLAFSMFIFLPCDVLLLDEVIAVGDKNFQEKSKLKITQLVKGGVAVCFVSHNIAEILDFCNKCMYLENGKIKYLNTPKSVLEKYFAEQNNTSILPEDNFHSTIKNVNVFTSQQNINTDKINRTSHFYIHINIEKYHNAPLEIVLYISNLKGWVLCDSHIFRKEIIPINNNATTVFATVKIPALFFNQGQYFIDIIIGFKEKILWAQKNYATFEVLHEAWEENKVWVKNGDYYPIRIPLEWNIKYT